MKVGSVTAVALVLLVSPALSACGEDDDDAGSPAGSTATVLTLEGVNEPDVVLTVQAFTTQDAERAGRETAKHFREQSHDRSEAKALCLAESTFWGVSKDEEDMYEAYERGCREGATQERE